MKKLAAILVGIYLAGHLSACTSKESREDESTPVAEETAEVDSELERVEGADAEALAAGDESQAGFVDEQLPEQALGEQPATDMGSELATEEAPPALDDGTAVADTGAPPVEEAPMEAPVEAPVVADSSEVAPPPIEEAPAPAPDTSVAAVDPGLSATEEKPMAAAPVESRPKASLKKVPAEPFYEGGQLLNAVYVARPGDNYRKISTMIYGDASRHKDLRAANPSIGTLKPGNKVYYNSPQRPSDTTAMKTYYEDMGLQPEVYVAKEGDNIRKVSKQLLGYDNAWQEVWSTNPAVESKQELMAGTELRYWKAAPAAGAPAPVTNVAANDMAAPSAPPIDDMPPPPDMAANMPPPPPSDMDTNAGAGSVAMNDLPPPPAEMAPPRPPPVEMAPPPPPPMAQAPPPPVAKAPTMGEDGMSNDDMMMGLAGIGIVAAGIAAIMVIRKRRQQKEMQAAFGDTQIGAS